MPSFVFNNTSLSTNKQDLFTGGPSLNFCSAADYNALAQACIDLRTALKGWQGVVTSTNYAALTSDFAIYTSATGLTITLPAGAQGLSYIVKDITGNASPNITINTTSAQTIDDVASKTITTAYGYLGVVWDTTSNQWRVDLQSPLPHVEKGYAAITTGTGNGHEYLDVSWSTPFAAATGADGYQVEAQISLTNDSDVGIDWWITNKTTTGFRIRFSQDFNGEVRWSAA